MKGSEAIKKFNEANGPVKKELTDWIRYCNTSMSAIRRALREGAKTVPELSVASKLPSADVLWFVNAMRKYGETEIDGDDSGYKKYALKDFKND